MNAHSSTAAPDSSTHVHAGLASTVHPPAQSDPVQSEMDTIEQPDGALPTGSRIPEQIDKFVILRQVGAGGMGVVYSAFDEYLERQVALKLVRGTGGDSVQQTRMLREAQALARLSHPNVVQIYEVGEYDSEVYLAMEFVSGKTLGEWMEHEHREKPVNVGAILDVFIAAGRGLAAAHQVGVVHRDFKPSNVLVGEDGRVCVLDFGLAASAGEGNSLAVTADAPESQAFTTELTEPGTILGTPAYMAPEQLEGVEIDVRADIFSFCVALHEALFGVRPFAGTSLVALFNNIHAGTREPLPYRKVAGSAWLIPLLERGLAPEPDDRWQSMEALLEALSDDPSLRRRRYWLIASVLAICTLVVAGLAAYPFLRERACEQRASVISELWNNDVRDRLQQVFLTSGSPHGPATWERVQERLGLWEDQWRTEQVNTCLAQDSPEVMAARTSCLQDHLWQFEGLLETFSGLDTKLVNRAVSAAVALPRSSNCHDLYWLYSQDEADTASDPELSRTFAKMEAALSAGRHQEIVTEVEPLLPQLEAKPRLRAEALFLLGRAFRRTGEHEKAISHIQEAYFIAGKTGQDWLAAQAAVVVMAVVGSDLDRRSDAMRWGEHAGMMIERAGLRGQEVEVKLLVNYAILDRHAGNYEQAAEHLLAARKKTETALGPQHPSIARILSNYANVLTETQHPEQAIAQLREGLEIFINSYGPEHPDIAVFYSNLGVHLINADRVEEGVVALHKALDADRINLGPDHPSVGVSLFNIGTTLDEAGDLDGAGDLYEQAYTILQSALGPNHSEVATVATAYGWLLARQGVYPRAQELLEQAIDAHVVVKGSPVYLAKAQIHLAQTRWLQDSEDPHALVLATEATVALKNSDAFGTTVFLDFEQWSKTHLPQDVRSALALAAASK